MKCNTAISFVISGILHLAILLISFHISPESIGAVQKQQHNFMIVGLVSMPPQKLQTQPELPPQIYKDQPVEQVIEASQAIESDILIQEPEEEKEPKIAEEPVPEKYNEDTSKEITEETEKDNESCNEEQVVNLPASTTIPSAVQGSPEIDYFATYFEQVLKKIEKSKTYPQLARKNGYVGSVKLSFKILENGIATNCVITTTSGYKILDREALAIIHRASPFDPIPNHMQKKELELSLTINFKLND